MNRIRIKNKRHKFFLQCLLYVSFLIPVTGLAQIKNVWALGDGEKVFRNDLEHPYKNGNLAWDGKTIRLKGLYNEVMAFQVILETGADAVKNVDVSIDLPVNKSSGAIIGGSTLKYGPAGTIEIFTQHYLNVKDTTRPNWFYGSPASAPKKMTGWIPDALIPTDALPGAGGFPVNIAASQNQGFWIDIQLPRDQKKYPAGLYEGRVQVRNQGKLVKKIPLEVTLLPYYLPDENHTTIWVFSSDVESYFPGLTKEQVDKILKFEGHRHRIDLVGGYDVNRSAFHKDSMDQYKKYLDGTAFTPANGYYGNGEGVGEKLFPVGMYGSKVLGNTKSEVQQQANLWVNWFRKNAPTVKYFWYMIDEPRESSFDWIKERSGWIKSNPDSGKYLPTFTTTGYIKALAGIIDYWAAYDGVDLKVLPEIRKNGGDHWFYNGNRPRYGSFILEGAAIDMRINSWILYKYGISTHFLWHSTAWRHNSQGPKGSLHQNIYRSPLTFINDDMEFGNGDGILFYPGHMPFYPEEERGLNRVFPSIRLKNIRRGQQDAEIMWMAEQKAGKEKVIGIISKVIPKALSEVSMKDAVPWSEKGDDYDKIRDELIQLLK
jgi:hypothetical protein